MSYILKFHQTHQEFHKIHVQMRLAISLDAKMQYSPVAVSTISQGILV